MKYIVLEIQTNANGTVALLSYQFDSRNEAESKFHYVLSFAATAQIPCSAAVLLTNTGEVLDSKYYRHEVEVQEEQ